MSIPHLLVIVNDPAFFVSHRLGIGKAAVRAGFQVTVATGPGAGVDKIIAAGIRHVRLPLDATGRNPVSEVCVLAAMYRVFRKESPDLVHLVTIKPVLYGGILARVCRIPHVVFAISGMGYVFGGQTGFLRRCLELVYRCALRHPSSRVIIQNTRDYDELQQIGALRSDQALLVPGSGVDLDEFRASELPESGPPIVILPARMLWEKGVGDFVEAARILRERGVEARFALAGSVSLRNPGSVAREELEGWQREGLIEWWGACANMPHVYSRSTLVVLPSYYREGLPKVLLEALACGRAVVTTDEPGCRDVVEPGENGLLVRSRDPDDLAGAIETLLSDPDRLARMGWRGREKAEREFGVARVIETHMAVYRELLTEPRV